MQRLGVSIPVFPSNYNITPTTSIPTVRTAADRAPALESTLLRWGLRSAWAARGDSPPLINARAESVATKPTFRDAFRSRRCVIPASGFYEWQTVGRTKKPWLFERKDHQPFGLAGVWDSSRESDDSVVETCAIITTEPNDVMRPIHNRMPVMLTPEQCAVWLSPATPPEVATALMAPTPNDEVDAVAGLTRSELLAASREPNLESAFAEHFSDGKKPGSSTEPDPFAPWFS